MPHRTKFIFTSEAVKCTWILFRKKKEYKDWYSLVSKNKYSGLSEGKQHRTKDYYLSKTKEKKRSGKKDVKISMESHMPTPIFTSVQRCIFCMRHSEEGVVRQLDTGFTPCTLGRLLVLFRIPSNFRDQVTLPQFPTELSPQV